MEFRVEDAVGNEVYNLLIGLVAPRPIALVTSRNEDGGVNAAPYSSYNYMAIDPPMVGLGLAERSDPGTGAAGDRSVKDTGRNIRRTGEFVVNVVTEDILKAMNVTGIDFPAEISEVSEAGLHLVDSGTVKTPRLMEAHAALECVEHQTILVGKSRIVLGRVVAFWVDDRFVDPKGPYILAEELHSVGRMNGRGAYVKTRDAFVKLDRIKYEDWKNGARE